MLCIPKDFCVPKEDPSCQLLAECDPVGGGHPGTATSPGAKLHLPPPLPSCLLQIPHLSSPSGNITELLHLAKAVLELDVRGDLSCFNRNKLQKSIHRAVDLGFWGLLIFSTHSK